MARQSEVVESPAREDILVNVHTVAKSMPGYSFKNGTLCELDSLDSVDFVTRLEEVFGVSIPDRDMRGFLYGNQPFSSSTSTNIGYLSGVVDLEGIADYLYDKRVL